MRRLLLCAPRFYGVEYEINPWMKLSRRPDLACALRQWEALRQALTRLGATIELLEPQQGLPDLVFTANGALVRGEEAILSRFRHLERQGEEPLFRRWFAAKGFRLLTLPQDIAFEGEGDALFWGGDLIAAYGFRSHIRSHRLISEIWSIPVVSLALVDQRFYHLDTCFCPLDEHRALYYPPAFDAYSLAALRGLGKELIALDEADAVAFACNAVVLGKDVLMQPCSRRLEEKLRQRGFRLHLLPLGEYLKAGGSAKCLGLYLDNPVF